MDEEKSTIKWPSLKKTSIKCPKDLLLIEWSHGGGADLPRRTVREALDFVIEEIAQTVLEGKSVKLTDCLCPPWEPHF